MGKKYEQKRKLKWSMNALKYLQPQVIMESQIKTTIR
jgi:hypothetical protein